MTERLRSVFMKTVELREQINKLAGDETAEGQKRLTELREQGIKAEAELVEALKAEPVGHQTVSHEGDDPETRERAALRSKATLGAWVTAAAEGRTVTGAEAEYGAACGVADGRMPVTLFERPVEKRVVTPTPATIGIQQHAILPALFDRSIAGFLGISMPTVPVGTPAYPYLTTSVTASMLAQSAAAPETAGAFEVKTASVRRLAGSFKITKEDLTKLSGLEESLRNNLSMVLSDQLDNQILNGDGNAPNLDGLFKELTDPAAPASGDKTFEKWLERVVGYVDGLLATDTMGLRLLVGMETYRTFVQTLRGADTTTSFGAYVGSQIAGLRSTRRVAAAVSNIQQAIIRRGMEADICKAPVWMGVEFIRDPYTGAGKGEIVITATTLLGGLAITRPDAFAQTSFRLA